LRRRLFGRPARASTPIALCIDVEPDDREVGEESWAGVEATFARADETRERLRRATGALARLSWFIRADPQIAEVAGDPAWLHHAFSGPIASAARAGDEIGLHVHAWRRLDDGWIADHGDDEWVARCVELGLRVHEESRGAAPACYRGGDRFLSAPVVDQLRDAGVAVDVTVEPLQPAVVSLAEGERATGSLPDYSRAPEDAFRPAPGALLEPATHPRADGPALVPLTAGAPGTLVPWLEPDEFEAGLEARCERARPSHLAFAIRSDLGRWDNAWERMLVNLEHAAARVGGGRFVTAPELAASIVPAAATR